jgi:hypothetical protein
MRCRCRQWESSEEKKEKKEKKKKTEVSMSKFIRERAPSKTKAGVSPLGSDLQARVAYARPYLVW